MPGWLRRVMDEPEGPSHARDGLSGALCFTNEPHGIADPDRAGADDVGVERQLAAESPHDIAQHRGVDLQCVGIHGRHVTASAQRVEPHDRVADVQFRARPVPFVEPVDAADDDIRTQPPDVASESGDGAVSRDEQREDIEAVEPFPRFEPGVGAGGPFDERKGSGLFHGWPLIRGRPSGSSVPCSPSSRYCRRDVRTPSGPRTRTMRSPGMPSGPITAVDNGSPASDLHRVAPESCDVERHCRWMPAGLGSVTMTPTGPWDAPVMAVVTPRARRHLKG